MNGQLDPHLGGIPDALANYSPATDYVTRQANIAVYAVKGEVLETVFANTPFNWIETSRTSLFSASGTTLDMTNKHSIDLHAAGLLSTTFNEWAAKLPTALPRIFDNALYGYGALSNQQDFLVKLVRNEVGVPGTSPNGRLTHFANDLGKLGAGMGGLSEIAQNALIAQSIEWYYWQGNNYSGQEFYKGNGSLLQYTTAQGDGLLADSGHAGRYVAPWLSGLYARDGRDGRGLPVFGTEFGQWSVSTGGAVNASARDAELSQSFIGQDSADTFVGGNRADIFFAGGGDDTLDGGSGSDSLYGGAGNDTYHFAGTFGRDTISDSDGQGVIQVDGIGNITGAGTKKTGANTWRTDDKRISYALVDVNGTRKDLYISFSDRPDIITVKNWSTGNNLGIELSDTPAPADIRVLTGAADYEHAEPDQTLDGLGGNDVLVSDANANQLIGGTGDDLLFGNMGDDTLNGGEGNDFLNGGAGHDLINGGAGDDIMLGLSNYSGVAPNSQDGREWVDWAAGLRWEWGQASHESGSRLFYVQDTARLDANWALKSAGLDAVFSGSSFDSALDVSASDTVFGGEGKVIRSCKRYVPVRTPCVAHGVRA